MDVKITCSCEQHVLVDSSAAGQEFACPSCGLTLVVPDAVPPQIPFAPPPIPIAPPPIPKPSVLPFIEYHTASLERLQQEGLVRKRIAKQTAARLPRAPWQTIVSNYIELLTEAGIRGSVDCESFLEQRAKVSRMNLGAVATREPDERPATEKQLNFLRSLGADNEAFLASLGIRQASSVIDYILENR